MDLTPDDIKTIREMKRWMQTNGQAGTLRPTYQRKVPRLLPAVQTKMRLIKAPSGGIPGRVGTLLGGVICDVWKESYTTQQIEDSGGQIKVMNWTTSAVCANGDRYGIAAWINGGWYIIAEDCNDDGSTTQPGSGSGTGGQIGDAIDTSTVSPVVGIGVGGQVLYSGGAAPIP
jgi:hypothetical protein